MLLYEFRKDYIDVYNFEADQENLFDYRAQMMKKQNPSDLFYYLETTDERLVDALLNGEKLDNKYINFDSNGEWGELKVDTNNSKSCLSRKEAIKRNYIEGRLDGYLPSKVVNYGVGVKKTELNLLPAENVSVEPSYENKRDIYKLNYILNLPSELNALQLILNGQIDRVINSDLKYEDILRLFTLTKLYDISLEEFERIIRSGLVNETFESVTEKVDNSQMVLSKVRQINGGRRRN